MRQPGTHACTHARTYARTPARTVRIRSARAWMHTATHGGAHATGLAPRQQSTAPQEGVELTDMVHIELGLGYVEEAAGAGRRHGGNDDDDARRDGQPPRHVCVDMYVDMCADICM